MSDPAPRLTNDHARMVGMIIGGSVAQAICSAVELELPQALADGPRGLDELVAHCGADARYLERLLNALVSLGVFGRTAEGAFELTGLGETLLETGPDGQSLSGMAMFSGSRWLADARVALTDAVRDGVSPFRYAHGADLHEYMEAHHDLAGLYDRWSGYASGRDPLTEAVLSSYDFSTARHVVDVGGRFGALLGEILERSPGLTGTVFDLPDTAAQARAQLRSRGVEQRCRVVSGSFLDAVPDGGGIYILSNVLADWDDERARLILRNCRAAMGPEALLLVVEAVFAASILESSSVSMLDLWMMVTSGGGLRSEDDLRALVAAAGLHVRRVIRTASGAATLLEAGPS